MVTGLIVWRISLTFYRRVLLRPRPLSSYGKWAIVTGSTSGIGKEFSEYFASKGLSVLIISRSEDKLIEQTNELKSKYPNISVEHLAFDFSSTGTIRDTFYSNLDIVCNKLHNDGNIGILLNNVGTANEIPKTIDEFSKTDVLKILNCNVLSTTMMTKTVLKYMKMRKNGVILSISSGSGNHCGPFLALYSATK
jgi:17beta-estradiol 17-dehydrogenase / very-long-chain 3-oxoacyl-CoA reductase